MQGGGVMKGPSEVLRTAPLESPELGAGALQGAAYHVPDDHAVDTFATADHLGAQPSVDPDQAFRRGSAPELVQKVQVMNSSASVDVQTCSCSRRPNTLLSR